MRLPLAVPVSRVPAHRRPTHRAPWPLASRSIRRPAGGSPSGTSRRPPEAGRPPHASPFVRHASPGARLRPPAHPVLARSRPSRDDGDLHAHHGPRLRLHSLAPRAPRRRRLLVAEGLTAGPAARGARHREPLRPTAGPRQGRTPSPTPQAARCGWRSRAGTACVSHRRPHVARGRPRSARVSSRPRLSKQAGRNPALVRSPASSNGMAGPAPARPVPRRPDRDPFDPPYGLPTSAPGLADPPGGLARRPSSGLGGRPGISRPDRLRGLIAGGPTRIDLLGAAFPLHLPSGCVFRPGSRPMTPRRGITQRFRPPTSQSSVPSRPVAMSPSARSRCGSRAINEAPRFSARSGRGLPRSGRTRSCPPVPPSSPNR